MSNAVYFSLKATCSVHYVSKEDVDIWSAVTQDPREVKMLITYLSHLMLNRLQEPTWVAFEVSAFVRLSQLFQACKHNM